MGSAENNTTESSDVHFLLLTVGLVRDSLFFSRLLFFCQFDSLSILFVIRIILARVLSLRQKNPMQLTLAQMNF